MILWTIQTISAWRVLERTGIFKCNPDFMDSDFTTAYKWMAQQMKERLQIHSTDNDFPLWAWYQYESEKKRRSQTCALVDFFLVVRKESE